MAKPKNAVKSVRVRLDGNIPMSLPGVTKDARDQVFLDWINEHRKDRKAFPMMKELMTSILLGELGPQVQKAVQTGNTEETLDALKDLLGAFGGDDPST